MKKKKFNKIDNRKIVLRFVQEMANIHDVFRDNSYRINVKLFSERKIKRFKGPVMFGPSLCSVYLKLLLLGGKSETLTDRMSPRVASVYCQVVYHFGD